MRKKNARSTYYRDIFQWFFRIFLLISLLFCLALIPLFISMRSTFNKLQIEKRTQMLSNGVSQISSTVTGTLNLSQTLLSDSRFSKLLYKNADYRSIHIATQKQLKDTIKNLMLSYDAVSHTALQLDKDIAITDRDIFFQNQLDYYPDFFQVNGQSYEEWVQLLSDTGTGFTPACHIKTYSSEYDALIFVTPWEKYGYLYACMDISDLKELVIEKSNLDNCFFTVTSSDGTLLYSDLTENASNYQTFSEFCSAGNVKISVHIPNSVFYQGMRPFYLFFAIYIAACLMLLVTINILGTRHAAKPILQIINVLEQSRNIRPTGSNPSCQGALNGFDYVASAIINADQNIEEYQALLHTNQKILQARFLEKAISGQLAGKNDIQDFHACFPNFPESFCLLLIRLWAYTESPTAALYSEPLLLLQSFLETQLSYAHLQQINDTELLLVLSKEDYENSCETLNFMINNVNREEPSYHVCCIASDMYSHPEDLSTAYQQLRSTDGLSFSDYQTHICTVTDFSVDSKLPVTMTDLTTLYTAVTSGNLELSINRLSSYSGELSLPENRSFAKPIYDVIKTMLVYIRIDHSQLLMEQHIPDYQPGKTLYEQLSPTIETFCKRIGEHNNAEKDTFTQELIHYIDTHYTDCDICLTSLKTHFKCSESTIRKVFKHVTDVPIARYIEQKRMILANELLAQNEKTVTEIALACGYALPHSFYKAYKRVYGHAPTLP